mgnify:CR=1 FL=1
MIDKLIAFSIKNKLIIGLLIIGLIIWGGYSMNNLPIDAVPDITNNQVQVLTLAPTLAAQEVEQFITYPIEIALANVPGVIEKRSISRFGISVVTIVFKDNMDTYLARQLVTERLKEAEQDIPKGLGSPELAPITTGLGEIYHYVLHTEPGYDTVYTAMELRTIQDWIVKRQLAGTEGIAEISGWGGFLKQYEVAINPEKLNSMNVSIAEVFKALEKNNENTGGAYIEKGSNTYFIRGIGLAKKLEDIEKIIVKSEQGVPILIRDVSKVQYGNAIRYGAVTRNGEGEVVAGVTLMLKGANTAEVVERVKEKVKIIQKSLPKGVTIEPFIDRTKLIDKAIGTVTKNLIEGALIVIFILVLLLGNARAGLIVASVIPLSMLFAFGMMNLFGVSGNLMSLGAIDFGLIVDGAVIIVESIVHRITSLKNTKRMNQLEMDEEVYQASSKIRSSAAFGEIIILIVYFPILALVGIEGKMFGPMAQTVSFAILGAFLLSLTYVPMASALFLSKKVNHKRTISDKIMDFFQKLYNPIIHYALKHKISVLSVALVLFAISLFTFNRMGGEFIPTLEEGDLTVEATLMQGTSLSETVKAITEMEKILINKFPEVTEVVSRIGSSEIPTDPMPIERADIMVILKDKSEWTSADNRTELMEQMEEALEVQLGVRVEITQPIQMRFNELMTGIRQDVAVKIYGEDLDVLALKADEVADIISSVDGIGEPFVERIAGLPQINVEYNRDKIAQYELNIEDVNTVLKTAFAGQVAGVIFEGERRFDMVVRLNQDYRTNIDNISSLFIPLPSGKQVPLSQLATIQFQEGPAQISRDDTKRRIFVGFNVRDRDVQSVVEEIQGKLDEQLKLPSGYYITYGGQFENLIAAKKRLAIAVPAALLLIFVLLFFTFRSIKQSLLIFTAIPLSAIGGIFALYFRGMPFSISAGVGFIALFGVAVLNGIVLIGYFNRLKEEGMTDITERVLTGTRVRLRPVIMTAAVASLGFLPMALSSSAGAEVQKPLATVVIGGLLSATLLTLVVLPILYILVSGAYKRKRWFNKAMMLIVLLSTSFMFAPSKINAQTDSVSVLTLDQAIEQAVKNNASIKSANLEVERQRILKRTSFDLGKTNIDYKQGQFNSPLVDDNQFGISQNFAFPTVYSSQAKLAQANIKGSEQRLAITQNELVGKVKSTYYQLVYLNALLDLFRSQDSIYSNFQKAADLRFKTGEANLLEKTTAETQLMEVRNKIVQAEANIQIFRKQLQSLLQFDYVPDIVRTESEKREINLPNDNEALSSNPYLAYIKQQVEISRAATKVERSKLFPEFTVGYMNQSLIGTETINGVNQNFTTTDRFSAFKIGISIPLWFRPQGARVKAGKISQDIANSDLEYYQATIQAEFEQLVQQMLKYQSVLNYYVQQAVPQSEMIIRNAGKGYKAGEIGYVEYVQGINTALSIKSAYQENLNQYNQTIISLETIIGGK